MVAQITSHFPNALDIFGAQTVFEREETIFLEGNPARRLYRIISGAVRACNVLPDGRRQISGFFPPGDFVGLDASASYHYSAEAATDANLVAYSRKPLDAALLKDPRLAHALFTTMSRQLADARQMIIALGRKTAQERVATFLISTANRCGETNAFALPMRRADIADYLGLTQETLSRVFTALRAEGLITFSGLNIVQLVDPQGLSECAEGRRMSRATTVPMNLDDLHLVN